MMSQARGQEFPVFSELEKRVKSLSASEKALQMEVAKLRQKLAEAERELDRCRGGFQTEQNDRQRLRQRLETLIGMLSELPALGEEA